MSERAWWLDRVEVGQEYKFYGHNLPYGFFYGRVWAVSPTCLRVEEETYGTMLYLNAQQLDGATITPLYPPAVRITF